MAPGPLGLFGCQVYSRAFQSPQFEPIRHRKLTNGSLAKKWVGLEDYAPGSSNIAVAGKWGPRIEFYVFPIKNGGCHSRQAFPFLFKGPSFVLPRETR